MANNEVKAIKANAKAAQKAEKARRKASTDPADMGRARQIYQAYKITHEYDKPLPFLLLGCFLAPVVVGLVVGLLIGHAVYATILGILVGVLLALLMLVRRTKKATFTRYAGQAGSGEVALSMLPKQWTYTAAVAATRQMDCVHRAIGPGGMVLVGDGDPGRVKTLLASEVKKHERVSYGVKAIPLVIGDGKGQVPMNKLTDHIRKLPKTLLPNQVTDLKSRLRALDAIRPAMPIPKGPMPTSARQATKGSRQAMRGR